MSTLKYRLLNFITCPYCKDSAFPLELIVIEEKVYEERRLPDNATKPLCDLYCGYKRMFIKDLKSQNIEPPCDECIKKEVVVGVLRCRVCNRWYPIIDEIPRLLPDEFRKREEDIAFLERYQEQIPDEIKFMGKPFNISPKHS